MPVCGLLNTGASFDCDNKATGGIEQTRIVLYNRSDIDYGGSTVNRDAATGVHNISEIGLVTGAKGYAFEGNVKKSILSAGYSMQTGDYLDTFSHVVNVAIYDQCQENLVKLNQFVDGAEVVAVIEQKDKGQDNDCAFHVYGWHKGLKATEFTYNSNENNGIVLLPLSSVEGSYEPYAPYQYLNSNYANTLAVIDASI